MKRYSLLLLLTALLCSYGWTQTVPSGMNYQAVARDLKGNILANQPIELKINLLSDNLRPTLEYSESHSVITNEVGLFSLVIGEGQDQKGVLTDVPWSSKEIWIEISIKDKGASDFITINNSRLLAVPYAFHAGTAGELIGDDRANPPGVPANVWSLQGNSAVTPDDKLGTTDCADLIMITNNIERLRIGCSGDINIANSLNVGNDLDVADDGHFGGDLTVDYNVYLNVDGGSTTVNGDLTVANMKSTHLTGTLTVDKETTLNDDLTVTGMQPTLLTGTLTVDKATDLNSSLNVDGVTNLNDDLTVTGMAPTHLTGTLTVDKATDLNLTLNVDGATDLNSTLTVDGNTDLNSSLNVDGMSTLVGMVNITNTTESSSTGTGALKVAGGVGVAKNVHIGGTLTTAGVATINNTLNVNGGSSYIANFVNSTNANGISIQVNAATPGIANNFVTMKNNAGGTVGRIEGQTLAELQSSFEFIWYNSMESVNTVLRLAMIVVDLIGVDDADAAVVEGVEWVASIAEWAKVNIENALNVGVAFESGSGDYAEWLEKASTDEVFSYGDIVGIKGGKISKAMEDADRYMVISMSPIVLGNMPPAEGVERFEKVAFMGQVPVKVRGVVNIGDYILSSRLEDGFGIAVAPEEMTLNDYKKIVGIAWTESDGKKAYTMVNTAVGINTNDAVDRMKDQQAEINDLKVAFNHLLDYLQAKDPSFNAEMFAQAPDQITEERDADRDALAQSLTTQSYDNNIVAMAQYLEKNPEVLQNALAEARAMLDSRGIDYNRYEQTRKLMNDQHYFIDMLLESTKK